MSLIRIATIFSQSVGYFLCCEGFQFDINLFLCFYFCYLCFCVMSKKSLQNQCYTAPSLDFSLGIL
jgi:hypothetical protein